MSVDADIKPIGLKADLPELGHIVCCDDNLARCGLDVTHEAWDHNPADPCVVCVELDGTSCGAAECPFGPPP